MKAILETERLLLREFVLDDLPEFFGLASDPDVTRYTGDGCKTLEETRQGMIDRPLRDYRVHGLGRWAVVLKATGKVIGFAGLKCLEESGEVDLGYRFFKEFWGQGLATEAAKAILTFGITELKLRRIIVACSPFLVPRAMRVSEPFEGRGETRCRSDGSGIVPSRL